MLCQICLQARATIHVRNHPSDDPQADSHFCPACFDREFVHPPDGWIMVDDDATHRAGPPPFFSRPRFTIRGLMILVGGSALVNAALVLFFRVLISGTPAEIAEWTTRAVLFGNLYCAAIAALVLGFRWLVRWHWYATTGRWLSFSQLMREARLMHEAGISDYMNRAFSDELERAILWSFFWANRWHQYARTGRWLSFEELIPEPWQREGGRIPTHPRLASAGEWFFWVLGVAWLLLWVYVLGQRGRTPWIFSYVPGYEVEAIFTYILLLLAGELLIYSGMVAAALRRMARGRPEAEPPGRNS